MYPGESVIQSNIKKCETCGQALELGVHSSAAGYYIGTVCNCGPYSRETGYFETYDQAERALQVYKSIGVLPGARL